MASVIALVSVLASATVAICVPLLTARLEAARSTRQLRALRIDELRSVADGASVAVAEAERTLYEAELAVERAQARAATPEDKEAARVAVTQGIGATQAVQQALHRTAVRLGWDAKATAILDAAYADLAAQLQILDDVRQAGPCSDDPAAWNEVSQALDDVRTRYADNRARFYAETSQLVGVDT